VLTSASSLHHARTAASFVLVAACFLGMLSCKTSGVHFKKSPPSSLLLQVVERYCSLDYQGARLNGEKNAAIFTSLVTWNPKHEPAWDTICVVKNCGVHLKSKDKSKAIIQVNYDVLGFWKADQWRPCDENDPITKKMVDKVKQTTFTVKNVKGRWKITSPMTCPHVSLEPTIRYLKHKGPARSEDKEKFINSLNALEKQAGAPDKELIPKK
jgi:hypothetical protein